MQKTDDFLPLFLRKRGEFSQNRRAQFSFAWYKEKLS